MTPGHYPAVSPSGLPPAVRGSQVLPPDSAGVSWSAGRWSRRPNRRRPASVWWSDSPRPGWEDRTEWRGGPHRGGLSETGDVTFNSINAGWNQDLTPMWSASPLMGTAGWTLQEGATPVLLTLTSTPLHVCRCWDTSGLAVHLWFRHLTSASFPFDDDATKVKLVQRHLKKKKSTHLLIKKTKSDFWFLFHFLYFIFFAKVQTTVKLHCLKRARVELV